MCQRLIALLGGHHPLVEESLHALVALLGHFHAGLGLLPQLVSPLHLLLAGAALCHVAHGRGSLFHALCLRLLGFHVGSVEYGERVAHLHIVAFLHPDLQYAARHLARHAILRHFHFALNVVGRTVEGEIADECDDDYHCHKSEDCEQDVVMLLFC